VAVHTSINGSSLTFSSVDGFVPHPAPTAEGTENYILTCLLKLWGQIAIRMGQHLAVSGVVEVFFGELPSNLLPPRRAQPTIHESRSVMELAYLQLCLLGIQMLTSFALATTVCRRSLKQWGEAR
jgi:hypothetical protein